MSGRIPLTTAVVAAIALIWLTLAGAPAAFASFTSASSAALPLATATVHAPSGVTVSVGCGSPATLSVSWTGASGITASGYAVSAIKNQTGHTDVDALPGTATSISFNIPNWTSYTVQIQAQYGSWTSATSSQSGSISCP
jgi:hypothetical protein